MNIDGRPDGLRPFGYASLLEYFETRLDDARDFPAQTDDADDDRPYDPSAGDADVFEADAFDPGGTPPTGFDAGDEDDGDDEAKPSVGLDHDACRALREEAAQYYHRYVALLVLEDFEGVIRDTSRNLRVADLCREHAEDDRDRLMLEQVRPYIIMMRTRALAGQALKDEVPKAAIVAVDEGLDALRRHYESHDQPEEFEKSSEAQSLRQMRDALVPKLPVSQKTELRDRLHEAIKKENYELAAILRNELRMLGD